MTAAPHSSAADLPVRPGEDPWSDAELDELRVELEKEAAALRAELGDAQAQINARLGSSAAEAGDDEADTSSKLFEREHELALNNNMRALLEQPEHALGRIDAGTYGAVSYTHLRAHETRHDLVCRLLLEKKKKKNKE